MATDTFNNAIIFGASGDIGTAFSRLIMKRSRRVTLVARDQSRIAPELLANSSTSFFEYSFPNNAKNLGSNLGLVGAPYDLCVNCIGVYGLTDDVLNQSEFSRVLESNFGVLQNILDELRPFVDEKTNLINISSIAAHSGNATEVAYSSSKFLVDKLMSSLRNDETYRSVKTLNVRPGAVVSKMTSDRSNSHLFINPDELAALSLSTICAGSSLTVPILDVYKR